MRFIRLIQHDIAIKEELKVSARERTRITEITRIQSECSLQYKIRQKQITKWKCDRYLHRNQGLQLC